MQSVGADCGAEKPIIARQREATERLAAFQDDFDRCDYLMGMGLEYPEQDDSLRCEANEIRGCESRLWVRVRVTNGRLHIACDSDALLLRGAARMLADIYEGAMPEQVVEAPLWRMDDMGFAGQLTARRRGGLAEMEALIRLAARESLALNPDGEHQ